LRVKRGKHASYRIFNHTADIGFDVCGTTRKALFSQAAIALFSLLADPSAIEPGEEKPVTISGADPDDLWINYLRELLYLFNSKSFLVREVEILKLGRKNLTATARGEPYNPARHEILNEIKAVTYHQAGIRKTPDGWTGRFIVDV